MHEFTLPFSEFLRCFLLFTRIYINQFLTSVPIYKSIYYTYTDKFIEKKAWLDQQPS